MYGSAIIYLIDALEERIAESKGRAPRNPLFDQADSLLTRERLGSAVRPPRKR
jgi:hypothetical protein